MFSKFVNPHAMQADSSLRTEQLPSRRDFLRTALACGGALFLGGCENKPPATKPSQAQTTAVDFEELLLNLKQNNLNPFLFHKTTGANRTVVVYMMHHENESLTGVPDNLGVQVYESLSRMKKFFPFTRVGIEGSIDSPDSAEQLAAMEEIERILGPMNRSQKDDETFKPIRQDSRWKTLGLESRKEIIIQGYLINLIVHTYSEILNAGQKTIANTQKDSPLLQIPESFVRAYSKMRELPDFPQFSKGFIKVDSHGRKLVPLDEEHVMIAKRLRDETTRWINKHLVLQRNEPAVNKFLGMLDSTHELNGVIVFGWAHTLRGEDPSQKSIQALLGEAGANWIVIDPQHIRERLTTSQPS